MSNNGQPHQCGCPTPSKCTSRVKCKVNNIETAYNNRQHSSNVSVPLYPNHHRRTPSPSSSAAASYASNADEEIIKTCDSHDCSAADTTLLTDESVIPNGCETALVSKQDNFKLLQAKSDDIELSDHVQLLITEVSSKSKVPSVQERESSDDLDLFTEGG